MANKTKTPRPVNYKPDMQMIIIIIALVGAGIVMALTYEALFGGT